MASSFSSTRAAQERLTALPTEAKHGENCGKSYLVHVLSPSKCQASMIRSRGTAKGHGPGGEERVMHLSYIAAPISGFPRIPLVKYYFCCS